MAHMQQYCIKDYIGVLKEENMVVEYRTYNRQETIIQTLTYDSREVKEQTLFICKGAAFKPMFLRDSIAKGAVCYVSEKVFELEEEIPYIIVKDIRKAMAVLANTFYNRPWEELTMIGAGGTKGKSTSVYYMKSVVDDFMLHQKKKVSAVISSIDIFDGMTTIESHITTPESVELQRILRNAQSSGVEFAQMEISSQALKYHRVDKMRFNVGIFLNISEDHISPIEHDNFEDYFESKMLMFKITDIAVVNLDADYIERILAAAKSSERTVTFSCQDESADYYAYNIRKEGNETKFSVVCQLFDKEFTLTMPGLFNVENALGVIAASGELGIPEAFIQSGLKKARSSGRMELYSSENKNVLAIVDYAHNKLSFEKLFSSMKKEYPDYEIISIFGCPGKKALTRRADLGTIAGTYAKKVYLTAEDPGYEPANDISEEIAGYVKAQNCAYEIIEDRGDAIKAAMESVNGKTLLLVTGKGGETRQKYGSEYLDCPSDVEYVIKYLREYDVRCAKQIK